MTSEAGAGPDSTVHRLSDPRSIRALSHPVRLALLECLAVYGAQTATEAGRRIGESATTCSFHLRQLARYGYVCDAAEPGRRDRPWRLAEPRMTIARQAEGESAFVAAGLESMLHARALEGWDEWRRAGAHTDDEWLQASPFRSWLLYMTAEELGEFTEHLAEYVEALAKRTERPAGARPVQIVAFGHPLVDVTTDAEAG